MENNEVRLTLNPIKSLFSETWRLYKELRGELMEIALVPALILIVGRILLNLGGAFAGFGGVVLFIGYIVLTFSVLPLVFSIHHRTGVDASYKGTLPLFWPFIWVIILEALVVMGGFVMLIIPGIWLSVALTFTVYIFLIEGRRGLDALRQSKDYMRGYWWPVFGRIILLSLIVGIGSGIIQGIIAGVAGVGLSNIAAFIIMVFTLPFTAIYSYIIFENLRLRKPELADAHTTEGTGFLKASAIVGIFTPILIVILVISLVALNSNMLK